MQKDLGDIFLSYTRQLGGVLISVSEVRVSPDLSVAHVYLSIFPGERVQETLATIQEDQGKIRGELGNRERHQLRIIPGISFHLDETLDKMARIDELLGKQS